MTKCAKPVEAKGKAVETEGFFAKLFSGSKKKEAPKEKSNINSRIAMQKRSESRSVSSSDEDAEEAVV